MPDLSTFGKDFRAAGRPQFRRLPFRFTQGRQTLDLVLSHVTNAPVDGNWSERLGIWDYVEVVDSVGHSPSLHLLVGADAQSWGKVVRASAPGLNQEEADVIGKAVLEFAQDHLVIGSVLQS